MDSADEITERMGGRGFEQKSRQAQPYLLDSTRPCVPCLCIRGERARPHPAKPGRERAGLRRLGLPGFARGVVVWGRTLSCSWPL